MFSVSYLGDLVLATVSLEIIARSRVAATRLVTTAAAAELARYGPGQPTSVALARLAWPGWIACVLQELWAARRGRAHVLNLEVHPPRWRFLVRWCRLLGLTACHLDLPALMEDNLRSALRQPTALAHRSDYYGRVVGAEPPAPPPRLAVDARLAEQARSRLSDDGSRPLVLVHPGSSDPQRRASLDLLVAVTAGVEAGGCRPIVIGSAAESGLAQALLERLPPHTQAVDACGRLDVRELAALTSQADLFIGGDSGPLKIAEAVGARTLSFWHRGQPAAAFAGPRGPGHAMLPATASADEALAAARQLLAR